jgi:micrococcal nuclease
MFSRPVRRAVLSALAAVAVWALARQGPPAQSLVQSVVDGDTIELVGGERVRYVGIDTPEVRRRVGARWVYDPEPLAKEATEANRRLVEGRPVRLEYDVQPRDRYGRLLAYVYVSPPGQGEVMVNARLLEQGYAQPLTIPPNVKHAETFRALAAQAREQRRGLWKGR